MKHFLSATRASFWIIALALIGLSLTSLYSYILFHSLVELITMIIAGGIFILIWNTRQFNDGDYLLFIGISYLFVMALDLIHTLSYKGMGVFPGDSSNLSAQLWIAARYVQSLSLLAAPFFVRRRLNVTLMLVGYTLLLTLLILSIFAWQIFPVCFIEGQGLTPFKIASEYAISLILLTGIAWLLRFRHAFDRQVFTLLLASLILTIGAELAFTSYISVYGPSNLLGHLLKLLASYLIYKALIETGLRRPYALFLSLAESRQALQQAHDDLELRLQERQQALEALSESEQRFRNLFETMVQGVVYQYADGRIISANPAAERILGLSLEQLRGNTPFDPLWHVIYEDGAISAHETHPSVVALHSGQSIQNVVMGVFHPQDGNYVWINVTATPLFRPGEAVPYQVYVTFEDISARKINGDIMRARLRLMEFAKGHTIKELLQATLDEVGALVYSPIGFYHFVGADQNTITLQAWSTRTRLEFCAADGEDSHYPLAAAGVWANAARAGHPVIHNDYAALENKRGMPPGHAVLTRELVVTVQREGRVVAILGVGNKPDYYNQSDVAVVSTLADLSWDIIQQRRADLELRASEEKYRSLYQNAALGIFHSTLDGKFLDVNPALAKMLGYASTDDVIASIDDLAEQIYVEPSRHKEFIQLALTSSGFVQAENLFRRKDGSHWLSLIYLRVNRGDQEQAVNLEGFIEDISERKLAEERLKQSLAEKETLLRELYHRTRNNMGVINAILGLQADYLGDERLRLAFEDTQGRINSMALVHEKLYEGGDLSSVNLKVYITDVTVSLRGRYSVLPQQVFFVDMMEDVFVLIDTAIPCGLILNELVTNAFKYAFPAGREGEIRIDLRRLENGEIHLGVCDNGVGLPTGFDPRQDGALGLQMIFLLAENQLRARVNFQSAQGVSCQMWFKDDLYKVRVPAL